MNTSKILRFTNQVFLSDDSLEAKTIIMALGMIDKVSPYEPLTPKAAKTGRIKNIAVEFHDTHWLLISCSDGYKNKKDNGYTVAGWPKDQFSKEDFRAEAARLNSLLFAGVEDQVEVQFVETKPGGKN